MTCFIFLAQQVCYIIRITFSLLILDILQKGLKGERKGRATYIHFTMRLYIFKYFKHLSSSAQGGNSFV